MEMQLEVLERQLREQGFVRTYVWEDAPGARYGEHTHDCETAHIILAGEMTVGQHGSTRTYHPGERFDVPAGALHWAHVGSLGCRYLIGEK